MFRSIVLGLVQGLTEFLPISSSGHLVIMGNLFNFTPPGLTEVVAYHLGTLFSVLWILRQRLLSLFYPTPNWNMLRCIVLTTLVTGVLGLLLKKSIGASFESPLFCSSALLVTALILYVTDHYALARYTQQGFQPAPLTPARAVFIGIIQGFAAFPGISRSGTTLAGSFFAGLERRTAVEYSFLVSLPVIAGAFVLELLQPIEANTTGWSENWPNTVLGIVVSFLSGAIVLKWLLRFLTTRSLRPFYIYCAIAGSLGCAFFSYR